MRSYAQVKAEVEAITDKLGKHIEEGIKELVISLRMHGIETEMSCEGHQHGDIISSPWVSVPYDQAVQLAILIGKQNRPMRMDSKPNLNQWVIFPSASLHIIPSDRSRPLIDMQLDALDFAMWIRR